MKKSILAGLICLMGAYGAQAADISSISSGNWTNTATWQGGTIPGGANGAWVKHSVTAAVEVAAMPGLATLDNAAHLVLESGANLTVSNSMVLNKGLITVGAGASLSKLAGAGNTYIHLPRDSNNTVEMVIDGGSVSSAKAMYLGGQSSDSGITATLTLNDGSLTVSKQLIIGGGSNLDANMFINGGTAQMDFLKFGATDNGQTEEVTIDGGDLILTTGNEAGSLAFSGDWSTLFYESGSITFKGVNSETDFNTFTNTFNGWVDAGNVTSAVHTATQLKSMLRFLGDDAILAATTDDLPSMTMKSVASGSWTNGATWEAGFAPRDDDGIWIGDDDVIADGVVKTLKGLALLNNQQGDLTLTGGTDITLQNDLAVMDGEVRVEAGSIVRVPNLGNENYIKVARDAGATGVLTIDGGSLVSDRAMFIGLWNSTAATGTVNVTNGSLTLDNEHLPIVFGGAADSVSKMFINAGGSVTCGYINFDQGTPGDVGQTEELTLNGGDLTLVSEDYTNAISFAGSYSKVFFEGGSITVKGVDTMDDFNAYVPLFESAVDAQYFDSVTYTDEELKAMLQYYYLGDAVISDEEVPGEYGIMTTTVTGSDSMDITSSALLPGATNVLQFRTDLVNGSWSNLTGVTGTGSNTWTIVPLDDPQCFFRIIVE